MILQTESKLASIRGYGCYLCSLLFLWETKNGRNLKREQVEEVFDHGKNAGVIQDNDIKVGSAGWWRCFVSNPRAIFDIADMLYNTRSDPREMYRGKITTDTPQGQFSIIEYRTKWGSHFVAGRVENGEPFVTYNPDPRIGLLEIKSVRHWRI